MDNIAIPPGSYLRTSRCLRVESAEDGGLLIIAECQKKDGSWQESRIKYDIANCDGVLRFAPDGC